MPRFLPHKLFPSPESLKNNKSLRFLGTLLDNPNLFHMNRRAVTRAIFLGLFIGLLPPVPIQTPIAALAAVLIRSHLPLTMAIIWISNPLTIPIIFFTFYHLGRIILQLDPLVTVEFTLTWLERELNTIWKPYLVGSLVGSIASGATAYLLSHYLWVFNVRRKWRKRRAKRAFKNISEERE